MAFRGTHFISAVLLVSRDAGRLANFYRDVLGVPLEAEQHGATAKHYGCELGDLHFAIHPTENFGGEDPGVGSARIAFEVFDIQDFVQHLKTKGVEPLYAPRQQGPMMITAVKDPDGNHVEFTQLGEKWIKLLKKRREDGHCMIRTFEENSTP